jgi:hypothetical protein
MAELAFQERIWAQVCFSTCLSLLHHTASTLASITDLTRYPEKVADSITQAPKRLTGRVSLKGRSADPPQGPETATERMLQGLERATERMLQGPERAKHNSLG